MRHDFTQQMELRHKANKLVYSLLFGTALLILLNDITGIQALASAL